jgi:hypothetical protein
MAHKTLPQSATLQSLRAVALFTLICFGSFSLLYFFLSRPSTSLLAAWSASATATFAVMAVLLLANRNRRFSLRALLLMIAAACLPLAALSRSIQKSQNQRQAFNAIESLGGTCRNEHGMTPQFVWVWTPLLDPGMTTVRSVDLSDAAITDRDLSLLQPFTDLTSLNIANCPVTDQGLGRLESHNELRRLNIDGTNVTVEGVVNLFELQDRSVADALRALGATVKVRADGTISDLQTESWKIVRDVLNRSSLAELHTLDLSSTEITDKYLAELASVPQLRELNLAGTHVSDAGMLHLKPLKNLKFLRVTDTDVTFAGVKQLFVGLQHRPIEEAMIAYGWSTKPGAELSHTLFCPRNSVNDDDLREIGEMLSLRVLLLDSNLITDAEINRLAALTELEGLYLRNTRLTDRGVAELAGLKKLELLDLSGSKGVTSDALAQISAYTRLKSLNIAFTSISVDGSSPLRRMTQLQELYLTNQMGSEQDLAELRRALPDTKVEIWTTQ